MNHTRTASVPRLTPRNDVPENDSEAVEIDSAHVLAESAALEKYFQHGLRLEMNADELEGSEDNEDEQE